jgi:hypothetical protein
MEDGNWAQVLLKVLEKIASTRRWERKLMKGRVTKRATMGAIQTEERGC